MATTIFKYLSSLILLCENASYMISLYKVNALTNCWIVSGLVGALRSVGQSAGYISELSPEPLKCGISNAARLMSLPSTMLLLKAGETIATSGIV
jgi:hypothetical protein